MPVIVVGGTTVTPFTQEWFDSLPQFMRTADPAAGDSLRRFLSLIGDQADGIRQTYRRIDFIPLDEGGPVGSVSQLVSADLADAAWLPWLALAVGAPSVGLTTQQRRDSIRTTGGGWRGPTKTAIAAAAQSALTGTRYARVLDHTTDVSAVGAGTVWDVTVVTIASQTLSAQAVLDAVTNAGAKPAGVHLWQKSFTATVGAFQTRYPTVGSFAGKTVRDAMEAGL